jgi:4-amino-4-deoxy-L-arabinose transferase-like glycosyltransferase
LAIDSKRWAYAAWLILIFAFAALHGLHLSADFPNHTPWYSDWAKYTDEGWYGNAAVRAHLFGNWYMPGDFNPAPAVPLWPFLEWIVFRFTGVTIQAARGLAVAFFFANLVLSYLFLRWRGPRWMALLALTFVVSSPFLYCFSRLAILEPMLTALTLAALNLAIRLPGSRRPVTISIVIGVLFTLMMLTKTTAVFLLPAIGWALIAPLWPDRKSALRCALASAGSFTVTFALWMALVAGFGLLHDYQYLFFVNKYVKPKEFYWPLLSLWWSFHGGLWVDRILIPLAGLVPLGALLAWRSAWSRQLRANPAFGASLLAVAGYILFMTYQNHPQPRYFTVVAFFSYFVLALGIQALLSYAPEPATAPRRRVAPLVGFSLAVGAFFAVLLNADWTLDFALNPEYTFVPAAQNLTRYIDQHPNGKRLLLSISGDEITMITHLPTICDDFGTLDLVTKLNRYQPGWFATWNDLDPGTLEDIHNHFSLEQVASFHAFDDPDRDVLVLFKLHPLPDGQMREPSTQNLQVELPGEKIGIPIE